MAELESTGRKLSEAEWRSLIRWLPEGVTQDDLTPDCTYENFARMNNAWQKEIAHTPEEEREEWAKNFIDKYCEEHHLDFGEKITQCWREESVREYENKKGIAWISDKIASIPVVGWGLSAVADAASDGLLNADLMMHSDPESGWATAADVIGEAGDMSAQAIDTGANVTKVVAETAMNTDWGRMLLGGGLMLGGALMFGKGTIGTVGGAAALLGGGYMLFKELRDSGKLSVFGIEPKEEKQPEPIQVDAEVSTVDEHDGAEVVEGEIEDIDYSVPGADSFGNQAGSSGYAYA